MRPHSIEWQSFAVLSCIFLNLLQERDRICGVLLLLKKPRMQIWSLKNWGHLSTKWMLNIDLVETWQLQTPYQELTYQTQKQTIKTQRCNCSVMFVSADKLQRIRKGKIMQTAHADWPETSSHAKGNTITVASISDSLGDPKDPAYLIHIWKQSKP